MLTPSKNDPNRKAELARRKKNPHEFAAAGQSSANLEQPPAQHTTPGGVKKAPAKKAED